MKLLKRKFPKSRLRRTRMKSFSRKMVSENNLTANDVIWPVFLSEGDKSKTEIKTLPSVYRYPIELLLKDLEQPINQGLNAVALFPHVTDDKKDEEGSYAFSPDNLIFKAVKRIKQEYPNIGVICDVALDPYTTHAHDGIISNNEVDNDKSLEKLVEQALMLADAGADIISVHIEATHHLHRAMQMIKNKGILSGVAVNPHTRVDQLFDILEEIDLVCLMSVNPGFGGQKFIYSTLQKVRSLREEIDRRNLSTKIEIDGGVGLQNAEELLKAGADVLVAGSAVFKTSDPMQTIEQFKCIGQEHQL